MITAVLDTNVLASGFAGFLNLASTPGLILRAWRARRFQLVVSEPILTELSSTLTKPYFRKRLTAEAIVGAHSLLRRRATLAAITEEIHGVATHPEDDLILATAVSARVDYLVTGDHGLQELGTYRDVAILSPRAFLDLLAAQQDV